jgi:hypothetical protein
VTDPTPLLDCFKRGEVPREARLEAAQGTLAPRPHEQLAILVMLIEDPDLEVRTTAEETLNKIPIAALQAFLAQPDVAVDLREFFADRGVFPDEMPDIHYDAGEPLFPDTGSTDELVEGAEDGEGEDDRQTAMQKLSSMNFTQRLKAAVRGSREMRAILVRDSNKMIAAAVMSSPKLSEPEVASFSKMGSVSEDVLRIIAGNRAWMKNYQIVVALAKNSKTPLTLAMNLMPRLTDKDLQMLAVDRNVPEPLRVAARKKVVAKATGGKS